MLRAAAASRNLVRASDAKATTTVLRRSQSTQGQGGTRRFKRASESAPRPENTTTDGARAVNRRAPPAPVDAAAAAAAAAGGGGAGGGGGSGGGSGGIITKTIGAVALAYGAGVGLSLQFDAVRRPFQANIPGAALVFRLLRAPPLGNAEGDARATRETYITLPEKSTKVALSRSSSSAKVPEASSVGTTSSSPVSDLQKNEDMIEREYDLETPAVADPPSAPARAVNDTAVDAASTSSTAAMTASATAATEVPTTQVQDSAASTVEATGLIVETDEEEVGTEASKTEVTQDGKELEPIAEDKASLACDAGPSAIASEDDGFVIDESPASEDAVNETAAANSSEESAVEVEKVALVVENEASSAVNDNVAVEEDGTKQGDDAAMERFAASDDVEKGPAAAEPNEVLCESEQEQELEEKQEQQEQQGDSSEEIAPDETVTTTEATETEPTLPDEVVLAEVIGAAVHEAAEAEATLAWMATASPEELELYHAEQNVVLLEAALLARSQAEADRVKELLAEQEKRCSELTNAAEEERRAALARANERARDQLVHAVTELQRDFKDKLDAELAAAHESERAAARVELQQHLLMQEENHRASVAEQLAVQGAEIREQSETALRLRLGRERAHRIQVLERLFLRLKAAEAVLTSHAKAQASIETAHSLFMAAETVSGAVDRHESLGAQLQLLRTVGRDNEVVKAVLAQVPERAEAQGVCSLEELQSAFPYTRTAVHRVASVPEGGGFWSHALSHLISYITFERHGLVGGDDTEAVLARAHHYVQLGDIAHAAAEINRLRGVPREAAADWLADARVHLEVTQALAVVRAHIGAVSLSFLP